MKRSSVMSGPLLPGEASTVIIVVAGLFGITGILLVLLVAYALVAYALGSAVLSSQVLGPTPSLPLGLGLNAVVGLQYLLTARWLYEGRRRGAYLALAELSISLLSRLNAAERPASSGVALSVAILVGLALTWPHLSGSGRVIDPPVTLVPRKRA